MRKITAAFSLATSSVHAQLYRAGNTIEEEPANYGSGLNGLVFVFIGVLLGLVLNFAKPNLDVKVCMIAGGVFGFVVQVAINLAR